MGALYNRGQRQWKNALALALAASVFLLGTAQTPVLLFTSSLFTAPQSAFYAAAQVYEGGDSSASVPVATAAPTPSASAAQNDADAATPSPTPTAAPLFAELSGTIDLIPDTGQPDGTGIVIEKHYEQGTADNYISLGASSIQNLTYLSNEEILAAATQDLPFSIELNSSEPQVLIMHTHATETYRLYEGLYFDLDDSARTTDKTLDVCAVGAVVAQTLNDAGIYTLHDTTLNDYPSYDASYDNSRAVVQQYLEEYPSIKVVIDVHRDAIEGDDVRYAPVAEFEGTQTAQVMIIAGCDNGGSIDLPNCMENLSFAAAWQEQMEQSYPGLTRSAMFAYRFYNQDLTTGSLLLEVGGHGNTLNEALAAAKLAALALAEVLSTP